MSPESHVHNFDQTAATQHGIESQEPLPGMTADWKKVRLHRRVMQCSCGQQMTEPWIECQCQGGRR